MILQNKSPKAIHEELVARLGDNSMSYSFVKKWAALFKAGRESVEDDERSGRPSTAVTQEYVAAVENFVMDDRRVSVRHIAAEVKWSVGSTNQSNTTTLT